MSYTFNKSGAEIAWFTSVELGKLITDNTLNELITAIKSVNNDSQTLEIQREYFKNVKQ